LVVVVVNMINVEDPLAYCRNKMRVGGAQESTTEISPNSAILILGIIL
jgi:hypothetical protein